MTVPASTAPSARALRPSAPRPSAPRPSAPRPARAPTAPTERSEPADHPGPVSQPEASAEARRAGFVLYVAADTRLERPDIDDLARVAGTLSELVREWLPHARTRAVLSGAARSPDGFPELDALREEAQVQALPTSGEEFRARLAALPTGHRVVIDLPARLLVVDGEVCTLTRQEFDLLRYLALAAGRVVSREELHDAAWQRPGVASASRTVDVHVRRLRAKSGLDALITTVRGAGYRLNGLPGLRIVE